MRQNKLKTTKKHSYFIWNWVLLIIILTSLILLYVIPSIYFQNLCPSSVARHYSSFMTADGLVTTSTFAFVAFASISPSASGSTLVMNRLGWKGIYAFRYPVLLIASALLTLADSLLTFNAGTRWEIIIGTTLSTAILVYIIIKYTMFNRSLNKNASKILIAITRRAIDSNNHKKLDQIYRNYWNPLRITSNTDLIERIVSIPYIFDFLVKHIFGDNTKNVLKQEEWTISTYINLRFASKILELFKLNDTMNYDMKLYIYGVLWGKMFEKNRDIDLTAFIETIKEKFLTDSEKKDFFGSDLEAIRLAEERLFLALDKHVTFKTIETNLEINR